MCCYSGPVRQVYGTNIFGRMMPNNRQRLVYSMTVRTPKNVAMILPIPTPPNTDDSAVRFIDFSGFPDFFDALDSLFPQPEQTKSAGSLGGGFSRQRSGTLEVVKVGSFEASFVPNIASFERLDPIYRISNEAWKQLPVYNNFGFAVFKLKEGDQKVHPMAFDFPTRNPGHIFFPTLHIHEGKVYKTALFDHQLYFQSAATKPLGTRIQESERVVPSAVLPSRSNNTLAGLQHVYRLTMKGRFQNQDVNI